MIVCRKTGEKMSAWKWMARICSKTPWMKTWSLRVYYWWKKLQYQKGYVEKEEINPKKVIFEAYMGKKYACSPKALYQAMCRDPQYQDWELIWAFREPEKYREMEQEPHTKVVRYRSGEYYRAYASAKFWVTNSRLPRELQPKEGQEYIQCWHGTPLKRLGYDLDHYAEKNGSLREVQENYLEETKRVTHMPSPSEFYSEKIASAFHLKEEGKEQVLLEMGYPRNDDLVKFSDMDCEKARQELRIPKGKKVILYAPGGRISISRVRDISFSCQWILNGGEKCLARNMWCCFGHIILSVIPLILKRFRGLYMMCRRWMTSILCIWRLTC